MAKNSGKTYWPHMILGFLVLGITLSYWTVKSASSIPVQESNQYMLKYQMADMNINQIMEKRKAFDTAYAIHLLDVETMVMTDNVNSNRPQPNPVKLSQGMNAFTYDVVTKEGTSVSDANVTFLLTRPHSRSEDQLFKNIPYVNGKYRVTDVNITKAGRYTLQLRAEVGDTMGYSEVSAYLKP
ncbi:FixH family protein [Sulfurovum sp. XGS-02]|uniref:FixH family protein n=1 Tax=Sulfurovum sp. XGS-02 TaxID=2925411 RepID=UPI0020705CA7|nr:FixH family protein [Sulfurovum sp. XGS-02]UPT77730.1 FixH family protein [Sulfurovum sp. XGS-02]